MMMLAIEPLLGQGSVAVRGADGALRVQAMEASSQQAERLVLVIQALLAEAGMVLEDLTHMAVTAGPGSFTAARIGLALAKGFGLAVRREWCVATTLELMAFRAQERGGEIPVVVALFAHRGQCYVQRFSGWGDAVGEIAMVDLGELAKWQGEGEQLVGDGWAQAGIEARPEMAEMPDAGDLLRFAESKGRWDPGMGALSPVYVRAADAKLPKPFLQG